MTGSAKTAAILGGGVIGGGWAARFLLMGWDVRVFDPDPESERKIGEVIANARASLPGLTDGPMPEEGKLSFHATISEAVSGAAWVQESVPERLDLKRKVYQTAQAHMEEDAILGSSTSGFKPSELQGCASAPGQIPKMTRCARIDTGWPRHVPSMPMQRSPSKTRCSLRVCVMTVRFGRCITGCKKARADDHRIPFF